MDDGTEARRADLELKALSANVAGKNGIQHAAWWKIALVVALIVAAAVTSYRLTAARPYTGRVEWRESGTRRQVRLGTAGTLVDLDESTADITIDGAAAMLPAGPLPGYLSVAPAKLTWAPYLTKRDGASGEIVTLDLKP